MTFFSPFLLTDTVKNGQEIISKMISRPAKLMQMNTILKSHNILLIIVCISVMFLLVAVWQTVVF